MTCQKGTSGPAEHSGRARRCDKFHLPPDSSMNILLPQNFLLKILSEMNEGEESKGRIGAETQRRFCPKDNINGRMYDTAENFV